MFFTREDILKIQEGLTKAGVKDSEFEDARMPLKNSDILVLSQDGKKKCKDIDTRFFIAITSTFFQ